jgi:hypothetical protein
MNVVEKAIFDEPIPLDTAEAPSRSKSGNAQPQADGAEPETLIISAKDTVRARRHRRLSASSDLAVRDFRFIVFSDFHQPETDPKGTINLPHGGRIDYPKDALQAACDPRIGSGRAESLMAQICHWL